MESPLDEDVTDELESPPFTSADPPTVTAPGLLPIRGLPWSDFEKLVVALASKARGLLQVRCYGRQGQRQYGIDVYGTRPVDGVVEVLQARNVADVNAASLRRAVSDYVNAGRRLSADTFILCVGIEVADTAVDDALVELRNQHRLGVELWDARRMSEELRNRPDTVEQFFGPHWREAFCPGEAASSTGRPSVPRAPTVDALLLGPVRALRLEALAATASNERDPDAALIAATRLEEALRDEGYDAVAARWRTRRARTLAALGRQGEAFDIDFEVAVQDLATDPLLPVATLLHRLEGDVDDTRAQRRRALRTHAEWWEHRGDLTTLRDAAQRLLQGGDRWGPLALLWHLESALVDRNSHEQELGRGHVNEAITLAPNGKIRARLQAAASDIGGAEAWGELYQAASTRTMPVPEASYLSGRAARWFAWQDRSADAQAAYRRAVELAVDARLPGDAAAYLRSLTEVHVRTGSYEPGGQDRADATRALAGRSTFLDLDESTQRAALAALADGRLPDAHDLLRRLSWEALVTARLDLELDTYRRLGVLYSTSDELPASAYYFALAGQPKAAADAAGRLGTALAVDDLDISPAAWHRAAAYAVIAAQGDLMSQGDVERVVGDLITGTTERTPAFGAHVAIHAYNALGGVALQLGEAHARAALEAFDPVAAPDGSTYVDDAYADLLAGLYLVCAPLHDNIAKRIGAVLSNPERVPTAFRAIRPLRGTGGPITAVVQRLADDDPQVAADALVMLGVEQHPAITATAADRASFALARSVHNGGSSWSAFADYGLGTAELATLDPDMLHAVVGKMLVLAEDVNDLARNRANATDVLGAAGGLLDQGRRPDVFERLMLLAADTTTSVGDRLQASTQHALSRGRINIGAESLRTSALRSAAYLADSIDERERVAALAIALSAEGGRAAHFALADVASVIGEPQFSAATLALSPSVHLRKAAAHIYCRGPNRDLQVALQLAGDADTRVRREFARVLGRIWADDPAAAIDATSVLEQDPSATIRTTVARTCPRSRSSGSPSGSCGP